MTFLELVNKIMRRMREPIVGAVAENTYSLMIGEFVNDAKRVVEDAWSWRALIDVVPFPTVAGTVFYDLEDYNCTLSGAPPRENARVFIEPENSTPLIRISTDNHEGLLLKAPQSYKFIERVRAENDLNRSKPDTVFFSTNPSVTTGNSNLRINLYPIPDAAYTIQTYVVNPQNDLTTDGQVILVPSFPVLQLAYLYALYERGEEIGEVLTLTSEKADSALSDAIAQDSSMTSEFIFRI